jgi:dTDP-4-amino-4,6-dideoxygalactose transaminase
VRSVLDAGNVRFVTSGRIAIGLALREMDLKSGDSVLVPAWHSPSMIPPVLWRGARPVFYRLRPDTSVDLADVVGKLDSSTRVLMVTHYFGFPQPEMSTIRAFCDARGIKLLEDCAHCLIGEHQGRPVGAWGDYAVASSMKFLPIYATLCGDRIRGQDRTGVPGKELRVRTAGRRTRRALAADDGERRGVGPAQIAPCRGASAVA